LICIKLFAGLASQNFLHEYGAPANPTLRLGGLTALLGLSEDEVNS
jgi:hypothetical protein